MLILTKIFKFAYNYSMNEENLSIFKLFLASNSGSLRISRLLEKFGKAENVFKASAGDLMNISGIGAKTAEAIVKIKDSGEAERELALARKNEIGLVMFNEENYPQPLKNYLDMPAVLYVKGNISAKDYSSLSIVGSRKCTNYGKAAAADFAGFFARREITVVSGLARGIDTEAHKAAIQNKGRTIAVLGNGLLVNYPPENRRLQSEIPDNGAVISEYRLTKFPDKSTFPRRNRIISALSQATLVIEAAQKSGALITARYSVEFGKDVFVLPGNIYSQASKGSNMLIKEGAAIALSPEDMSDQTPYFAIKRAGRKTKKRRQDALDEAEKRVLELISDSPEGLYADEMAEKLNIEISSIAAIILRLEINGLIRPMPGQLYIRAR